jgi:hypothetical protein
MTVKVAMESTTSCISRLEGAQEFSITSTTSYPALNTDSSSCSLCYAVLSGVMRERNQLEYTLANLGYPSQTMSPDLTRDYDATASDPCQLVCNDIVVADVGQIATYRSTVGCQVTQAVKNDIQSKLNEEMQSHMTNQQDIFGKVLGGLTKFKSDMSTDLSNIMASTISTRLLQKLQVETANLQVFQVGNVGGSTHSVYIHDVQQAFTINQVGQLKVVNNVMDQLRQSAQYSLMQDMLNKNDTLGTIADTFVSFFTIWSNFIKDTLGKMFIICLMVLLMIVFYKSYQYTMTSVAMQKRHEMVDQQKANMAAAALKYNSI